MSSYPSYLQLNLPTCASRVVKLRLLSDWGGESLSSDAGLNSRAVNLAGLALTSIEFST